tara:strand:- start:217 stop:1320 length:1104 start_codon:yes stop_codon:yes gene_type:complete
MAWGKNGTPNTLTSSNANMNVSDLGGSKSNVVLSHTIRYTGNTYTTLYLNNENSSSSYARRQSENGGADGTATSGNTVLYDMGGDCADKFEITYIVGISSEEKLAIGFGINSGTSGAGTVPERGEFAWKWADTSSTIDRIDNQSGCGSYDTGSNLAVLGSDITPADAVTFPTNVQAGSRAEITDSRKMHNYKEQPTPESTATYQVTDTSGTQNLYTGSYYISAQRVKSTSVLVGKRVSKLQMNIYKSNSPTGTATAGVWNSSGELQYTFGTIDVSTLETSTTEYTFNNTDSTHVFSADEYFGIKYQAGSSSNKIVVSHDDASPPFDGTDSVWSRYNGSWGDFDSVDNTFKLYLATEGGTFAWQEIGA